MVNELRKVYEKNTSKKQRDAHTHSSVSSERGIFKQFLSFKY